MKNVLIVDDKYENNYILEQLLQSSGFETRTAENGMDALNLALLEPPDLIISDILMPVMDGFTFCTSCKKNPVLKNIPFIFYTATYTTQKDEDFALSLGANRFVVKPMEIDEFLAIIESVLHDFTENTMPVPSPHHPQESVYLKEYNEVLIRKLENKMIQAEQAEQQLRIYTQYLENQIEETLAVQNALKKSEAQLQSLIEDSRESIWAVDREYNLIVFNRAFAELLQSFYNVTAALNMNIRDSLSKEQRGKWQLYYAAAFKGDAQVFISDIELNGEKHYEEIFLNPIRTDGIVTGVSAIGINVTARKKSEKDLQVSERRYRTIFSNTGTAMIVFNTDYTITLSNDEFKNLTGFNREYVENKMKISEFIYREDIDKVLKHYNNLVQNPSHSAPPMEIRILCRNNILKYIICSMAILPDGKKCVASLNDITMIKETKQELMIAKEKAQAMNRLKSNFLANMSHELRTPMIGILGYSELLIEKFQDLEIEKFARNIHKGASRLMDTLNMILDFSIIESESLELSLSNVQIDEILRNSVKQLHNRAIDKNICIKLDIPGDPLIMFTNERMVREIIYNLLNNAVKFTKNGSITLEVRVDTNSSVNWCIIKIIDTGIGIAKEHQSLIWEEFRQVSEGMERGYEGTGLGLTITRRFVEKLNGTIHLESDTGRGSVFTVRLPVITQGHLHLSGSFADNQKPNKFLKPEIIIIEGDSMTSDYMKLLLEGLYTIQLVDSLEIALLRVSEQQYRLILIDLNINNGNNVTEFIKKIRMIKNYSLVPIIAITSFSSLPESENIMQAGCNFQLTKPFSKGSFLTVVEKALG
ncbi:MAG: response regulator [Ignavibacteriales bacterium]|nr:response regulator [Ignavibacteriales bacterium]